MSIGFILDLDGVICDTAKFHFQAWEKLAAEYGYTLTNHDNEALKGVSRPDSLKFILQKANKSISDEQFELDLARKNEWYLELISNMDPTYLLTGVADFFDRAEARNIPIALGSASRNANLVLEKLGLKHRFMSIVDANLVTKGKPDPETFTTAAAMLGIPPNQCFVFEDSAAGIQGAIDGHMTPIGIGNPSDLIYAKYCFPNLGAFDFQLID